ncbi:PhzF family phenazine biosynthesis protein [Pseudomonas sp. N040]|uniref:PhzF family phenazine biosynthesis protein n=1 Tax=Pseudomonas sp. N040 TaxID=2785325 RepID=UPI0018A31D4D|nr:PhzF family phenazine biosynthesis protein [Pseudomonas sp. N040]MBF7729417.1 PhzF family phenazine biosynthesis protein [Pseudomonas sp. N040]MBW7013057.1 PhzF family phenazine biosynthesis protein [Pseudomonas sp. N040]
MQLDFHQVDAFSSRPFSGNPAMVYRLDAWLDAALMQQIAAEHNLAETAFMVREDRHWHIRWFTPGAEVPLCGHATLAAAQVLFEVYDEAGDQLDFHCKSGRLGVAREGEQLVLDFPALIPQPVAVSLELEEALGVSVVSVLAADKLLAVLDSEQSVRACQPDFALLARLPWQGVIITAQGDTHDFVSRFFAPAIGINEDPVTGSAHCSLIPYWSQRLKKTMLRAYQCSRRGGELHCRLEGARVKIGGQARLVASGRLWLD